MTKTVTFRAEEHYETKGSDESAEQDLRNILMAVTLSESKVGMLVMNYLATNGRKAMIEMDVMGMPKESAILCVATLTIEE